MQGFNVSAGNIRTVDASLCLDGGRNTSTSTSTAYSKSEAEASAVVKIGSDRTIEDAVDIVNTLECYPSLVSTTQPHSGVTLPL